MRLVRYKAPLEFRDVVHPFLLSYEAENNLLFGLTGEIIRNPNRYGRESPHLYAVLEGDSIRAAVLQTPPFFLVVSYPPDERAMEFLAEELHSLGYELPGVTGPSEASEVFASRWCELSGCQRSQKMAQRIYKLEKLKPPSGVPGSLRPATVDDTDLIIEWFKGFNRDTFKDADDEDAIERFTNSLFSSEDRRMYLWEDGDQVSMTLHTGPTPNGIRIGAVYTPPEKRRRGYASACVAGVSQKMFDAGRSFCFLYTDLANPTSNHIYQELGYEPVCDSDMWGFSPGDSPNHV